MLTKCSYCQASIDSGLDRCPMCQTKRVPWPRGGTSTNVSARAKPRQSMATYGAAAFIAGLGVSAGAFWAFASHKADPVPTPVPVAVAPVTPIVAPAPVIETPKPVAAEKGTPQFGPPVVLNKRVGPPNPNHPLSAADPVKVPLPAMDGNDIYETARKSVVVIFTDANAQGSGFTIDGKTIITNAHVISGAKTVTVRTMDNKSYATRELVALDANKDIAILKMPPEMKLPALSLGSKPRVGDTVYALGAPQGFDYTITRGLVSQFRQTTGNYTLLQTDTSISPGSSGGPLLNANCEVVGVTTLASRSAQDANNLNFAICSDDVKKVVDRPQPSSMTGVHFKVGSEMAGFDVERAKPSKDMASVDEREPMEEASKPTDGQEISSSDGIIRMRVPKDWSRYTENIAIAGAISPLEGDGDKFQENVVVFYFPGTTGSLEDFYKAHLSKEVVKALKSMQNTTIDNKPAKRVMYSNSVSETYVIEYLIKSSRGFYAVMIAVRNSDYGRWKDRIDSIADSIHIKN